MHRYIQISKYCVVSSLNNSGKDIKQLPMDDWYLLLGLLTNVADGWDGRSGVWDCLSFIVNEDKINEINFSPCRTLVLKFVRRYKYILLDL
jgi:hypothetical protein